MKKIIYFVLMVSILFSYTSIYAYDYIDKNNEGSVKSQKKDIYERKKMYEELAGEKSEDAETLDYTNVSSNQMWWPIGSKETTTSNGKTFAKGNPEFLGTTSGYGNKESFRIKKHGGLDISAGATEGQANVIAAKDGIVVFSSKKLSQCPTGYVGSKCGGSYGNYVMIQHSDGYYTLYAHLYANSITVNTGDSVNQGQVIGKAGSSGSSSGTHLHFEVRDANKNRVNPLDYISMDSPRPTDSVVSGNSNQQTVCLTLKENGYNNSAISAIMKNLNSESSGFNPTTENSIGAYGIAQWLNGRRTNLEKKYPKTYQELDSQLKFLLQELKSSYPAVNKYMLSTKYTVEDKTYYYCMHFEIPGEGICSTRKSDASEFVKYVENGCK